MRKQRTYATLAEWVGSRESRGAAARELDITESYLSMLLADLRTLSRKRAQDVSKITGVPVFSLLKINAA